MCWVWLFLAILLEVAATVCMKWSEGFSKLLPTLIMTLLYVLSFVLFALSLRRMEVGVAYALWSAIGTALVSAAGVLLFKEAFNPMKIGAIGLIIVGVIFLNLSETKRRSPDAERRPENVRLADRSMDGK